MWFDFRLESNVLIPLGQLNMYFDVTEINLVTGCQLLSKWYLCLWMIVTVGVIEMF